MELKVKGKAREIEFNKIGFIRELDEQYKAERSGVKFGFGLMFANMYLEQYSVPALATILKCALFNEKVTLSDVDKAIEDYAEETGDLEPLFQGVIEGLGNAPIVKATVKKLQEAEQSEMNKEAKLKTIS